MLKVQKRGFSQVDWAISLGIFMLFLAWFFIFIAPSMRVSSSSDSLSYVVESKLKSYFWNVYKTPIFMELNRSFGYNEYQPFFGNIYLDDSYNYSINDGLHYEKLFDKIVFLANLSSKFNTLYLYKSSSNYEFEYVFYDLIAGFLKVEIKKDNFISELVRGHVDRVEYSTKERIKSIDMEINGQNFRDTLNFSYSKIFSAYQFTSDSFNYYQILFANNPGIYKFFETHDGSGSLFTISEELELDNYPFFYIDNRQYGQIDYDNNLCYNYSAGHLTFYDNFDGISITFSKPVELSFCARNYSINLKMNFNISEDISYKYAFYKGSYELSKNFMDEPRYKVGVSEVLTGINKEFLNSFNYTKNEIKKAWGFPESKNFRIVIYNPISKDYVFDFATSEVDVSSDVYSKEFNDYILDKNGNLERVLITIMTW